MHTKQALLLLPPLALLTVAGCTSPCDDYCDSATKRLIDCGILRDSAVVQDEETQACITAIEADGTATDAQCEDAQRTFDEASCDILSDTFCGLNDPNVICVQCPQDDLNPCTDDVCVDGVPLHRLFPAGPVPGLSQQEGDCKTMICDENGAVRAVGDDADFVDDGNPCTDNGCSDGAPLVRPKPPGTVCDAARGLVCVAGECRAPCTGVTTVQGISSGSDFDMRRSQDVVAADVNGDGRADVVALSPGMGVSVSLNMGSGVLAPPIDVYWLASAFATADIDGDGKIDLVVTSQAESLVWVLLNLGDGRFSAVGGYPTGAGPIGVVAADMNGDGRIDVATIDDSGVGGSLSVLLNVGGGALASPVVQATRQGQTAIAAADVNNDDRPDLVVVSPFAVAVHLNQGDGTFAAPLLQFPDRTPESVVAADLNGDGRVDLAVSRYHDFQQVSVLLGLGDGDFAPPVNYDVLQFPTKLTAEDLDGDGRLDLAVVSSTSTVSVLHNRGDGTFDAARVYTAGGGPGLATGDLDGDGAPELIAPSSSSPYIEWLRNSGDGTFEPTTRLLGHAVPTAIAAGRISGADSSVLAVANNERIVLLSGDGAQMYTSYAAGGNPQFVVSVDVTGDAKEDLVVASAGSNEVSVLVNTGELGYGPAVSHAVGGSPRSVATGDLDGDGTVDIVSANEDSDSVSVLFSGGAVAVAPAVNYAAGAKPRFVAVGDLSADGKPDLVVASYFGNTVSVLLNQGEGRFGAPVIYPVDAGPRTVALGDFNGDQQLDLAVPSDRGGSVGVLFNDGRGAFAAGAHYAAGVSPWAVATADLDGDGTLDLAVANHGTAEDAGDVTFLHNAGNGTFRAPVHYAAGKSPTALVAADLNRDGRTDIAVTNESGGTLLTLILSYCQ